MAERRSSSDRKLDRLGSLADINARNTAASNSTLGALMQQLTQMYGLGQAAQMDPLKMEQMRLENAAMEQKNAWAQPMAEMQYNLGNAQATLAGQRATGQPTMADYLNYYQSIGAELPEWLLPPEQRQAVAQQRAQKEAAKSAAQQQIDDQEFFSFLEMGDRYDPAMGATPAFVPPQTPVQRPSDFLTWLGEFIRKNPPPATLTGF